MDPTAITPSAPVHAARLNGLLKKLANAEGAVAESIKARKLLIEGLEKMLDTNRATLETEEYQFAELSSRKLEIDTKKREVEDNIMRGFSSSNPTTPIGEISPGNQQSPVTPGTEADRPEVEALTPPGYPQPPAVEPIPNFDLAATNGGQNGNSGQIHEALPQHYTNAGSDLLSSLSTSYNRSTSQGSAKKRKLNAATDFPDLGGDDGLDDDVAEMLRQG